MALNYNNQFTGQSHLRQPNVIENHGKIDIHLNKNDQLSNITFINHGEVNVYFNPSSKCKALIERLLLAPQIIKEGQFNDISSIIAISFVIIIVGIIILNFIYYALTYLLYFILYSIFFIITVIVSILYSTFFILDIIFQCLYVMFFFICYIISGTFYFTIIFFLGKQGLSYLKLKKLESLK
jgi:hypothetical protein